MPSRVDVRTGKAGRWEPLPRELRLWRGTIVGQAHLSRQPHWFLKCAVCGSSPGAAATCWEVGQEEMGSKALRKMGLGVEGLASHQGVPGRAWARMAPFTTGVRLRDGCLQARLGEKYHQVHRDLMIQPGKQTAELEIIINNV